MHHLGKIYELTGGDVDEIIEDIIQNNEEIKAWCDRDEKVKLMLSSIFYDNNMKNEENVYQNYGQQYYGTGKKAGLYFRDTDIHICARDIVLEFIKIIFSLDVWRMIQEAYCTLKGIEEHSINVGAIIDLIARIKKAITNNVIKLTEEKMCFYLQIITHFREHETVSVEEILEWLPEAEHECCWCSAILKCEFRQDTHCMLKRKNNHHEIVQNKLDEMVDLRVLMENISRKGEYRINY